VTSVRNRPRVEQTKQFSIDNYVDLRTIDFDVASQQSADEAVRTIVQRDGRLDVIVHNAGHMVFGAAEAFTPEQLAQVFDTNVLSTQRVIRAALPQLCKQRNGLILRDGSTSTRGGTPPYLSPYFAAKAEMEALAVSYAAELNRWGIETSIIVPCTFTSGTNRFAHSGAPADKARQADDDNGPYAHLGEDIMKGLAATAPADADVADVARAIVKVVDMPFGKRPFRVHVDPAQDGAEIVNGVADRVRAEMYHKIGLADLPVPAV
jgi:NAD(P)-dependent dehydrogenase (short-subunit alcohol dehydrogenase family)